jgi:nucleoside-triphosphatase
MITREIREDGKRVGFQVEDIRSHEVGVLAQLNGKSLGAAVGRYAVNLIDLDRVGVIAIKRAVNDADVVVVDEIGPMELKSQEFILAVESALASKKSFLSTIHKRASHHLLNAIRLNSNYRIIEISSTNRDRLALEIVAEFT